VSNITKVIKGGHMRIPFMALIFQGVPEQIAVVTLIFVIAKVPIRWKEVVSIGAGFALIAYILRLLPITFGVHTVILLGLQFIILLEFCKKPISTSLLASLVGFLALILLETFFLSSFMYLFHISIETLTTNVLTRILLTWPQVIVLLMLAYIINKVRVGRDLK